MGKGEPQIVSLCWTPINDGGVREVVHLKLQKGRVRIIAYGKASTKKKSKSMKSSSIKGCDTTRVHNERESSLSEKKSLNNDPSTIVRKSILKILGSQNKYQKTLHHDYYQLNLKMKNGPKSN